MRSHLLIIGLNAMLLVPCSENPSLCQQVQAYSLLSVLSKWAYQVICWGLWSIWSWVLCRMINLMGVTSHPLVGFKTHAMRWNHHWQWDKERAWDYIGHGPQGKLLQLFFQMSTTVHESPYHIAMPISQFISESSSDRLLQVIVTNAEAHSLTVCRAWELLL